MPNDEEEYLSYTLTFQSPRAPVWGSFYAKDGTDKGTQVTAWNTGIGTDPETPGSLSFPTDWIPRPDTDGGGTADVPEASTVVLFGGGLLSSALGGWWRRRSQGSA